MKRAIRYQTYLTEAAVAAWPEVEPLAVAIFGEGAYAERVAFHQALHLLVARDGERVVGFKMGYLDRPNRFTSWLGGVDEAWRRQGIGDELMRRQHAHVASIGCPKIRTITSNAYKPMLSLDLAHGFRIIGSYTNASGEPKLILERQTFIGKNS